MKISAAGLDLIKEFEGLRLKAYLCPAGVLTIGYGHTSAAGPPRVVAGMEITKAQAEEILRADMVKYELAVRSMLRVYVKQSQFDALVSFAYNCGIDGLRNSTLMKRVNENRFDAVPAEFMKWTKARVKGVLVELPGLVRRRRAEAALWRSIAPDAPVDIAESSVKPALPEPSKSILKSKEAGLAAATAATAATAGISEIMPLVQEHVGLLPILSEALGRPALIATIIIVAASTLIWIFRKKRLDEEGA